MGNFFLLAFLLQSLTAYVRELFPNLDGRYVMPFVIALGIGIALAVPEVRIAAWLGLGIVLPWIDAIFSGACLALGAKLVHQLFRSIETYREAAGVPGKAG